MNLCFPICQKKLFSQVVIKGQVYVEEDYGGAIKTNCIDIYVATHEEGEAKGVYYTDVYLIQ